MPNPIVAIRNGREISKRTGRRIELSRLIAAATSRSVAKLPGMPSAHVAIITDAERTSQSRTQEEICFSFIKFFNAETMPTVNTQMV